MRKIRDARRWLVWLWLIFTVALATWQFIFQTRIIGNPEILLSSDVEARRYIRMVTYENAALIFSLIGGGVALFLLLRRERSKSQALQEFFATFTHEIKTSLAAIKLRAESLQGPKKELGPWYREELLGDLNKLQIQLENSLFLARGEQDQLLTEKLSLKDLVMGLGPQMALQLHLQKNCWIMADRRAMESILKNIVQNSALHGKAENLWIEPKAGAPDAAAEGRVRLHFRDDGQGPPAEAPRLGELFYRPQSSSGNGIGLYLLRDLSRRMGGDAWFAKAEPKGFLVTIDLPGSLHG